MLRRIIARCLFSTGLLAAPAHAQSFTEFSVPGSTGIPSGLAAGPDGNLWFALGSNDGTVGKMTPAGTFVRYLVTSQKTCAFAGRNFFAGAAESTGRITVGPDGNLWFALRNDAEIVKMTPTGSVTRYSLNLGCVDLGLGGITTGLDGNIWFTQTEVNKISSISLTGQLTTYELAAGTFPENIVAGRDGNLWYGIRSRNKIGRITPSGAVTEFTISGRVSELTAGPDGNIWYTQNNSTTPGAFRVGRITPAGTVTDFAVPTPAAGYVTSSGITEGPDGNIWFTQQVLQGATGSVQETIASKLARLTTSGTLTEITLSQTDAGPSVITMALGNLYFVQRGQQSLSEGGPNGRKITAYRPTVDPTPAASAATREGAVYSSSQTATQSFLRFHNTGSTAGTVTVTLSDYVSGAQLTQWTSPSIAAGTSPQYALSTIEAGATPSSFVKPLYYSVSVTSSFFGTMQHVLYRPADGTVTNASVCSVGVTAPATRTANVHSALLSNGYPSTIMLHNTGGAASTATLGLFDSATGTRLATYPTASIPANGQVFVSAATLENAGNVTPTSTQYHYTVAIESAFTGYLQHLVTNQRSGVITDMTTACPLSGS